MDGLSQFAGKKKGKKIVRCIPRNPKFGWYNNVDTFVFDDGTQYNSEYFTGYVYHKWITQRWSCSACPFTSLNRVSDITIGDAWGKDKAAPGFDDGGLGCSVVMVNTEKGRSLFKEAAGDMLMMPVDVSKLMQPVMMHPTAFHPKRQKFEDAYSSRGYRYARLRYLNAMYSNVKTGVRRSLSKVKQALVR